ncbi:halocin C8-like domain-containing protein [Haloterrigena salifodinae]|uniref:halocin C8-like domain-containing protein n=1 Tax=Haloterrigena salifodinae TaxID=2675099 RepID=UPI000F85CC9B
MSIAELKYINDPNENIPKEATKINAIEGGEVSTYGGIPPASTDTIAVQSDAVTAQQFDLGCWGCKKCFELICQIGWGAGTAFICGVLSGSGYIAGGTCFTFTQIACKITAGKGCAGQYDYEELCADPRLDLC